MSIQRATRSLFSRSGRMLFLVVLLISGWSSEDTHGSSPADKLVDLTGGVIPLITYDVGGSPTGGGQLFSRGRLSSRGEIRYLVQVKNQTGDPIEADSLIVVVHHIQEMARLRDITTLLVSDLAYLHAHLKDNDSPTPVPYPARTFPSHVHQQANMLLGQLEKLEQFVSAHPEWLTR